MKNKAMTCTFLLTGLLTCILWPRPAAAQSTEVQQLLLNVEKLDQFRQILNNMYKGYQILYEGYHKIKDITSGNFKLHELFLDGLLAVSPAVRKYHRIPDIIKSQLSLLKEYKWAWSNFRESGQFSEKELSNIYAVYSNLVALSTQQLDELLMIVTSGTLRMSDSERLEGINRICDSMEEKLVFLRDYNRQYGSLALQRAKDSKDINTIKQLYNIK